MARASFLARSVSEVAEALASHLLSCFPVPAKLIAIKQLTSEGKQIPVLIFRSPRGCVFARCLLGVDDTPIVDGETPEAAFALLEDLLGEMLTARALARAG